MYRSLLDLQFQQEEYYNYCDNGDGKGKLERLFGEEREFSGTGVPVVLLNASSVSSSSVGLSLCSGERRERVGNAVVEEGFVEEKWKFQAEMLRAECNFLRKERELALRKLEKNKVQMQRTLRSAVETLISVSILPFISLFFPFFFIFFFLIS